MRLMAGGAQGFAELTLQQRKCFKRFAQYSFIIAGLKQGIVKVRKQETLGGVSNLPFLCLSGDKFRNA